MNNKKLSLIALVSACCLLACSIKRTEYERRLEGKWKQVGGSGILTQTGIRINYTFTSKKQFLEEVNPVSTRTIKDFPAREGAFYTVNDSIYLYHDDEPSGTPYSAKLVFSGSDKFAMIDANGEMDFERVK